jgi:hypothetical protein
LGFFVLADARKNGVEFPESQLPETIGAVYAFGSAEVVQLMEIIPTLKARSEGRGILGPVADQMRLELMGKQR